MFREHVTVNNFDQEFFLNDLEQKKLNSIVDKCDNVNSAYENFESEFISVGLFTRFRKSKISHTFFSGAPLCSESMSQLMSPKIKTLSYKVEILSKVSITSLWKLLSLIDCGIFLIF
jgi:hypothetical protein